MNYALLRDDRGRTTVLSQKSEQYAELMMIGNHTELFTGTRRECQQQEQEYQDEIELALGEAD